MNPMAAVTSLAQSQLSGLIAQVSGAGTKPLTTAALTNMASSLGALTDTSSYLSGTEVPPAGTYEHRDLASHYRTAYLLGSSPPANLAPATAAAPLTSQALVTSTAAEAASEVGMLVAGMASDAVTAAAIGALAAQLDAVVDGSDAAIGGLRALVPVLADAGAIGAAAASAVVSRSADVPEFVDPDGEAWDDLLQTIVQPAAYVALKAAALAASYVPLPVLGPMAPTMPLDNVALRALVTVTPDGAQSVEVV